MTEPIEFVDPPWTPSSNTQWSVVVAQLKGRPHEWAKIAARTSDGANNLAKAVRHGSGTWAPRGAFEATCRSGDVYARYIGPVPS
jgi:hypothetical protein